jgi:ATP-dependent DNA ligase
MMQERRAGVRQAGGVSAVPLPAPVALARLVDSLTPPGAKAYVYQPKWDGYRALYSAGRLYSRNGTNLTPLFPDLVPTPGAD